MVQFRKKWLESNAWVMVRLFMSSDCMKTRLKLFLGMTAVLAAGALVANAQNMHPRDVDALPVSPVAITAAYGSDPLQTGDLRLPSGNGAFPVVIVIHGGCWTKGFATRMNTGPLASALTSHGYATWNIEYRQVGDEGAGWPGTFFDWGAATDYLRVLAKTQPIKLDKVVVVGHSAGACFALSLAARPKMPVSNSIRGANPLPIHAAVVFDGPPELAQFIGVDAEVCHKPVIAPLMGGTPDRQPDRYKEADPARFTPLNVDQLMIKSAVLIQDDIDKYEARVTPGDRIETLQIHKGGHFDIIAPGSAAWKDQVEGPLLEFLRKESPPVVR
jgi:acetyl esterase/lipase